ncbi:MAG: type II toxin-antitoxin system VapC family toxin [Anaerolineae bacterium]|nr:type II toxin-antitoxin system VapC family toxin [Anaerolineae bacterium]
MEMIVDTSVIIAVIANEPEKHELIKLTKGVDLVAPLSVNWEIGNAFSAMLKQNRVTLYQALQAIEIYNRIMIRFVNVELDASLKIAAELNIYAYDAYLIRCALKYNLPLLTLDQGLQHAAQLKGIPIIKVT